jgi:UDP-N-acetylmuramoyl-tripeptide--D-alanyl-D-alanine ligase
VIKGKSEMYDYLSIHSKGAFVNLDDAIQEEKSRKLTRYGFSQHDQNAMVYVQSVTANPFVVIQFNDIVVNSHLIGLYNANNINAAITIGRYFGVADVEIKEAIESYVPANNRSQMLVKGTNEIILDAYNANPSSMAVAIDNFLQLEKSNKKLIIGDMFELGDESLTEHKQIIECLLNIDSVQCFFIGNDFYANKTTQSNFYFYKDFDEFSHYLKANRFENSCLLIKGSRGMALERTLEYI